MFCNFCGRQNKDDVLFCEFCGKAMTQKNSPIPEIQRAPQANQPPTKADSPKTRISFTAIKAVITGVVILGLVIVVLQIYYPGILPWNW
jgi:uncharacterized membrane protein YvbJ